MFKLHPPSLRPDSEINRPQRSRLGELGGGRAGEGGQEPVGTGRKRSPKGPARPAVQTKLRPQSGAFPVRPTGDSELGPATRGASPSVRGAMGVRAAASSHRCALASGPRGPLLSRPGRRAARNKGAAAAPARPASLRPARPARSPQPPPGAARHPPADLRRQGPGQSRDLGCAAGQPRGRTHRCSTRTTGSRWGTWLSPGRCRRWS